MGFKGWLIFKNHSKIKKLLKVHSEAFLISGKNHVLKSKINTHCKPAYVIKRDFIGSG